MRKQSTQADDDDRQEASKDHDQRKDTERIRELEREVANLRNRRMTASGGLSAADKLKVLDLIAIVDTLQDDNELMKLRIADLKTRLIAIMKTKKEMK